MPASFDLIDQPFIPVIRIDGLSKEVGLREALQQAHQIVEIRDASPLITISMHRLLLALLHSIYRGPKNRAARVAIRETGSFDPQKIDAYFEKWKDRFDLFHSTYPFLQRAGFKTKEPSGINRLAQELSRGNNAALFDHTIDNPPPEFTPAQAARLVIAEQAFAVGGGKSDTGNTTHAPLVSGAIVLARGANLFETLWLNLTEYDGKSKPLGGTEDDTPIWERKPRPPHEQPSASDGYLDYLIWPARTLALHPEEQEDGTVVVRRVSYSQGRKLETGAGFYDPMIAYFRTEEGDRPVRFNEYKDLWRDSASLFQFAETAQSKGPTTLHTLAQLKNELPQSVNYQLSLVGLCTDKAKVLFWRHETLPLPLAYLDDENLVAHLKTALTLAEEVAKVALRPAAWATAVNRLTGTVGMNPDTDRVRSVVDAMAPERFYWSRLELPFRTFMTALADAAESERNSEVIDWYWNILHETAVEAFEQCVATIDAGRDLKAVTAGRGVLVARLRDIRSDAHIPNRQPIGAQ
jgi:CRISPR system Cascade subunit CasA